jgi:hypothetical protein
MNHNALLTSYLNIQMLMLVIKWALNTFGFAVENFTILIKERQNSRALGIMITDLRIS